MCYNIIKTHRAVNEHLCQKANIFGWSFLKLLFWFTKSWISDTFKYKQFNSVGMTVKCKIMWEKYSNIVERLTVKDA